jgi:hypothetical protein
MGAENLMINLTVASEDEEEAKLSDREGRTITTTSTMS